MLQVRGLLPLHLRDAEEHEEDIVISTAVIIRNEAYSNVSGGTEHMTVAFTDVKECRLPDEMC